MNIHESSKKGKHGIAGQPEILYLTLISLLLAPENWGIRSYQGEKE